jgi:hypothetical protein
MVYTIIYLYICGEHYHWEYYMNFMAFNVIRALICSFHRRKLAARDA